MSFLYRPTPVVNLGDGAYSSRRTLNRLPGSTMAGIPAGAGALGKSGPTGAASRMRRVNTSFQPWLQTSGSMHGFIPNGLGDASDISDPGIDWSTFTDVSPILPVPTTGDLSSVPAPDLGSPSFAPNLPALIAPSSGPLPPPPVAGAGPTGTGIPGTQPLNPAVQASTGILSSIANFFKPSAPATGYKSLPGYGLPPVGTSYVAGGGASWFTQSTIIPSIPNVAVLGIAVIAVMALSGGSGGRGR